MNILFLDYDGVINIPMWNKEGTVCKYDRSFQCIQWVSEFCQKFNYKIVVTSIWRFRSNYKEHLINGGLRDGVEIIGKTEDFRYSYFDSFIRGDEIQDFIDTHRDLNIENFIILDDDKDMGDLIDHLILCDATRGFGLIEFEKAKELHMKFLERKLWK